MSQLLVLNRADLESLALSWTEILDTVEEAFVQKANGLVQNPAKTKVASRDDAFIHAMPAYLGGSDRIGMKWVAGYNQNSAKGLPFIHGAMIINDSETGQPVALLDGAWITELRTPAVSGVTMRHVPGEFRRLAIIGCGLQGRRHLEIALHVMPELTHVSAYDRNPGRAREMLELAGDRTTRDAATPTAATEGADLVITSISSPLETRIDCANADPDALLMPIDYVRAMSTTAIADAAIFCVDDPGQYASVADTIFAGLPTPDCELAAVVAGQVTVPTSGRRAFLNMGIAMADVALASLALDRALVAGVGQHVAFP